MTRKLLSLLVLLMTAATSAWAQDAYYYIYVNFVPQYNPNFAQFNCMIMNLADPWTEVKGTLDLSVDGVSKGSFDVNGESVFGNISALNAGDHAWEAVFRPQEGGEFMGSGGFTIEKADTYIYYSGSTSINMGVGESTELTAFLSEDGAGELSYSSSDASVVSITKGYGYYTIQANAAGTVTITFSFAGSTNYKAADEDITINVTVEPAGPTVVASGDCGTDVTYSLTSDGVLTISGTGAMEFFTPPYYSNPAPWLSSHASDITSVVIEDGVTNISDFAFYECSNLASVSIPASVTSIGEAVFYQCDNLASVSIPAGVTSIGELAFMDCDNLASVIIPASVTSIGVAAFMACDDLETVTVYTDPSCTLEDGAFGNCQNLNIYVFPDKEDDFNDASGWKDYAAYIRVIPSVTVSGVTARQNPDIATDYWCTYYHPHANVKINTTGVQMFKASLSGSNLTLTEVDGDVIKAGQAMVLKASASGDLDMELTSSAPTGDFSGNELKGVAGPGAMTSDGTMYVLNYTATNGVGFYKLLESYTLGVGKAYLTYTGSLSSAPEFFSFGFSETTGLKAIENGQWTMDNVVYDLQGRRVVNPTKGLYIVNGKKVFINK